MTSDITFPDSQAINSGDTLTLKLPQELTLITVLNFNVIDVKNDKGEVVGTAQVDPNNQTVTVTFSDYFSRLPENKRMSLNFNVRLIMTQSKSLALFHSVLAKPTFHSNIKRMMVKLVSTR